MAEVDFGPTYVSTLDVLLAKLDQTQRLLIKWEPPDELHTGAWFVGYDHGPCDYAGDTLTEAIQNLLSGQAT